MAQAKVPAFFPWVIPATCEGCGDCVGACPQHCLSLWETTAFEGVFVPWMDNVEVCTGCGRCEQSCIWAAISLTSYVEEARRRFLDASAVRRPQAALYCTAQSLKSGRIDQAGEEL